MKETVAKVIDTLTREDFHGTFKKLLERYTLEERYAIKFCFKLGKMQQKRMECFRLFWGHLVWIEHQFCNKCLEAMRDYFEGD